MYAKVKTGTLSGLEGELVTVEADLANGLPTLNIVGLPDRSVREARERIRSAFLNSGLQFPPRRLTINLSPADTKKEGTHFDLPIAMGVAAAFLQLDKENLEEFAFIGELSLSGRINPVKGVLPVVFALRQKGVRRIVVPQGNVEEAALVKDCEFFAAESLLQVLAHFGQQRGTLKSYQRPAAPGQTAAIKEGMDFAEVKGQEAVKRAFLIAAAGGHNLLLSGPPGTGKTMMARRLISILPPLQYEEQLEITKIYSAAGQLNQGGIMTERPFCDPHHTVTTPALFGGGSRGRLVPGQVTLAHHGVLFLDELPEFSRSALEGLRQPLEEKQVVLSRNGGSQTFPCDFMLLAAMNPCPCGYRGHPRRECTCLPGQVNRYQSKLSGPLLDRLDMVASVPYVQFPALDVTEAAEALAPGLDSTVMQALVTAAREKQARRFSDRPRQLNAQMTPAQIRVHCQLDQGGKDLLRQADDCYHISGRTYGKILRLSRTIADLDDADRVKTEHVAESIRYSLSEWNRIYK